MKNTIIALSVFIISSINIISQDNDDTWLNPFWDFYSFNYLNTESAGRGFTGIASNNNISGILMNPASVNLSSKYQVNLQYTYKTSNPWLKSIAPDVFIRHQLFSGSVGFGYRINKEMQTGFVYNNPSSLYFDLGTALGLNGQEFDYYNDVIYHSFNVPFVYGNKNFRLGINLNYVYSRVTFPYNQDTNYHVTNNFFRAGAGFIFNINRNVSVGAKVQSGGRSEVSYDFPGIFYNQTPDNAVYPWKFGIGLQYKVPESLFKILLDYNLTYHNVENLRERHDFHIGAEKGFSKNWFLRGGFFTILDYRNDNVNWVDPVGDYTQYFFTLGLGFKQNNFTADIAVLTSEISPGIIKTTYINGGLTFNF